MENFAIKPNTSQILRTYFFISLILPALPFLVSLGDFLFNRTTFKVENYYEGYIYMGALGGGIFLLMILLTLPAIFKEKVYLTDQKQLIFQPAFRKPQATNITEIIAIDRGYKQVGNGKVQVVNIYCPNQRITFELKKYLKEDVLDLITRLKSVNPNIDNRFDEPKGFKSEFKKYFR